MKIVEKIVRIVGLNAMPSTSATGYNIMATDSDMLENMSKRFNMWQDFAKEVGDHIETYTVPQYGDYPNDQLTEWSLDDIKTSLKRYVNRMGNNQRGEKDQLLDFLKIANYACAAWHKFNKSEKTYE